MADVVKTTGVLQLVAEFTDGDDRTFTLDYPQSTVSAAAINEVGEYAREHQIIIGDKAGADFMRFKSAKKIGQTIRYLDLS